jgi:hypothetical protein
VGSVFSYQSSCQLLRLKQPYPSERCENHKLEHVLIKKKSAAPCSMAASLCGVVQLSHQVAKHAYMDDLA